jgi:hypothetical protein
VLEDGLIAMGTFLDVQGAFGSTTLESICRASKEHGMEHNVVGWIHSMLNSRQILTTQMDCMMRVSAGRNLVPLLWSLVADEILVRYNMKLHRLLGLIDNGKTSKYCLRACAKGSIYGERIMQVRELCQSH